MRVTFGKNLTATKKRAKNEIDTLAGDLRSLFYTPAAGQESEYQLKGEEATAYLDDAQVPTMTREEIEARYPLLVSDASVDGNEDDLAAQAQLILQEAGLFKSALAVVNVMRRGAKKRVQQATTIAEIEAEIASMTKERMVEIEPALAAYLG